MTSDPGIADFHTASSGAKIPVRKYETEPGVLVVEVDRVYSTASVAKILEVSPATVAMWIRKGELEGRMTKAGRRVNHQDLVDFIDGYFNKTKPGGNINNALRARGLKEIAENKAAEQ